MVFWWKIAILAITVGVERRLWDLSRFAPKKVERSVNKGSLVLVEGKIKTRKWKDKNDQDRWTTEIAADVVISLDKSSRESVSPEMNGRQQGDGLKDSGQQGKSDYPDKESQAPPEVQINDVPYDEGDPF